MGTSPKGGMLVGYARVSTGDQNLDLQEDALRKAGCEKLYTDVASGAKDERAGLADAIAFLRPGDTLVVCKLDRLGRSLRHLLQAVTALADGERTVPESRQLMPRVVRIETFPRSPGPCYPLGEARGDLHRDVTSGGAPWPGSTCSSPRNNSGSSTRSGPLITDLRV